LSWLPRNSSASFRALGNGGSFPYDGPTLDPSGNLYGTATFGGSGGCSGGCGVVWELSP